MPQYTYKDDHQHYATVTHAMLDESPVYCTICNALMWKVPQAVVVTWGGLPPSEQEPMHPDIADMVQNEQRNRENYLMKKEIREND